MYIFDGAALVQINEPRILYCMKSSAMTKIVAKINLVLQRLRMLRMFDAYHRSSCQRGTLLRSRKESGVRIFIKASTPRYIKFV